MLKKICAALLLVSMLSVTLRAEDKPPVPAPAPAPAPVAAPVVAPAKSAVLFTLSGGVTEQANDDDGPALPFFSNNQGQLGIGEWKRRLQAAADSDKVGGVFLSIREPFASWEHALEIREAVLKIRKAKKPVVAFAEGFRTLDFLIATAADRVYMAPGSMLMMSGLHARQWFMKGTLDKLGIQADMHHVGAFKGAAEPLTLPGPSKESAAMMNWILDDYYAQIAEMVGQARGKIPDTGKTWIDNGPYTAKQALGAGLIDGVKSKQEAMGELKRLAGLKDTDRFDTKFGERKQQQLDLSNPFAMYGALFKAFSQLGKKAEPTVKPAIGVLYAEGMIVSGASDDDKMGSDTMIAAIERARKDANIKAVVMRINSPGGSALASEAMHGALLKLKAEKPLIVSMGSLAASGGYYIAAPADRIFAHSTSMVGSIGVVGGKLVTKGFHDWIGMTSYAYTRGGAKAGIFDTMTPFNEEEKKWFLDSMSEIYGMFVKVVKSGRGERLKDFESRIAGGKVFTGRQALNNGLVDEIGGLEKAIAFGAEKAALKEYDVRVINRKPNFAQLFFKNFSGQGGDDDEVSAPPARPSVLDAGPLAAKIRETLAALHAAHPDEAAVFTRQLQMLRMLQTGTIMAVMPFEITVKP